MYKIWKSLVKIKKFVKRLWKYHEKAWYKRNLAKVTVRRTEPSSQH